MNVCGSGLFERERGVAREQGADGVLKEGEGQRRTASAKKDRRCSANRAAQATSAAKDNASPITGRRRWTPARRENPSANSETKLAASTTGRGRVRDRGHTTKGVSAT